jgi:hypothetical protein
VVPLVLALLVGVLAVVDTARRLAAEPQDPEVVYDPDEDPEPVEDPP